MASVSSTMSPAVLATLRVEGDVIPSAEADALIGKIWSTPVNVIASATTPTRFAPAGALTVTTTLRFVPVGGATRYHISALRVRPASLWAAAGVKATPL